MQSLITSAFISTKTSGGDPDVFRPERFLTLEGKFESNPHVIPYGIGKRSCVGDLLARQELLLFIVKLLQSFSFVPPEDNIELC